jgi:hemerythrin superfamily protein
MELFRVERDINDHSYMEEKVVVPKVKQLEQEILKTV